MGTITEDPTFAPSVTSFDTTTLLIGGGDGAPLNVALKQLADRTRFLKDAVDSIPPPGSDAVVAQAGTAVSGQRIVRYATATTVAHASSAVPADAEFVFGLSLNAAAPGADVTVLASGIATFGGWAWTPGPIFLGIDGLMTQTAPSSGFELQVATAITATEILVRIEEPLYL